MAGMMVRRVLLLVQNVAWMEHYHGREAGLLGQIVPAVELDTPQAVAYVDDRDGEASELLEALQGTSNPESHVARAARAQLRQMAERWALHGEVRGVRA
jgi:hypothetical protein